MTIVLYVIALLIGTSLGLIGAGGAIVAVPAFVYLGKIPATTASGYALFVIAIATLVGAAQYIRKGLVDWRSVLAFGATTLTSIAAVRKFVMPLLPSDIDTILMLAFAGVLTAAGTAMLRSQPKPHQGEPPHIARLTLLGLGIGILSGFLGVGGGFLMTPALVLWANLDMKKAVGTSLVLISSNGIAGALADLSTNANYDWPFLLTFTGLTTVGVFIGTVLSHRIDGERLKKGFGYFVITLGIAVLLRELLY